MQTLLRSKRAQKHIKKFIQFLGNQIMTISLVLFLAALLWLLSWPLQTNKTYFSENALSVGSAHTQFTSHYVSQSRKELFNDNLAIAGDGLATAAASAGSMASVQRAMQSVGCELISSQSTNIMMCLLHAPKGNGKESIMISATMTPENRENAVLLLSLMKYFSAEAKWQNHDFVFSVFSSSQQQQNASSEDAAFVKQILARQRVLIREAIVLDFSSYALKDGYITLRTEGLNGELPNLDMVNVMIYHAHNEQLKVSLFERPSEEQYRQVLQQGQKLEKIVRDGLGSVGLGGLIGGSNAGAGGSGPNRYSAENMYWYSEIARFTKNMHDYPYEFVNLARHWWNLLVGVPSGLHGVFRHGYNIHAVTLRDTQTSANNVMRASGSSSEHMDANSLRNMVAVGRLVEGTVRSLNNLIEQLHHSFFIYFLASPVKYHGFEDFMPNLWMFILTFSLQWVVLYYLSSRRHLVQSLIAMTLAGLCGYAAYASPAIAEAIVAVMPQQQQRQGFVFVWAAVLLVLLCGTYFIAFPMLVTRAYDALGITLGDEQEDMYYYDEELEKQVQDEQRGLFRDWKSLKSFAMLYSSLGMAVSSVTHSALSALLCVYLSLLSVIFGSVSKQEYRLTRLIRVVCLLLASPVTLVVLIFIVQSGVNSVFSRSVPELLAAFVAFWNSSGGSNWILENSFYFYLCIICIPVHMIFLKLSMCHLFDRNISSSATASASKAPVLSAIKKQQ